MSCYVYCSELSFTPLYSFFYWISTIFFSFFHKIKWYATMCIEPIKFFTCIKFVNIKKYNEKINSSKAKHLSISRINCKTLFCGKFESIVDCLPIIYMALYTYQLRHALISFSFIIMLTKKKCWPQKFIHAYEQCSDINVQFLIFFYEFIENSRQNRSLKFEWRGKKKNGQKTVYEPLQCTISNVPHSTAHK